MRVKVRGSFLWFKEVLFLSFDFIYLSVFMGNIYRLGFRLFRFVYVVIEFDFLLFRF